MGLSVFQAAPARCEGCRSVLDDLGYHRATCPRTARLHTRHRSLVLAWRQVLTEAGGFIPQRNVERLLRDTMVRVPNDDMRRLDLVVSCLGIFRNLPLLCDVTCVSSVTGSGGARSCSVLRNGGVVAQAQQQCRRDYNEGVASDVAELCCIGVEIFGR